MEFHEKLQELRKNRGMTQEALAQALYVSRTAISKWESGRGYPNLDSLKAMAKFFSVSIDELLSDEQMSTEKPQTEARSHVRDVWFGLLDLTVLLFLFLPLFGKETQSGVHAVSLLFLTGTAPYLIGAYVAMMAGMSILGILMLALQNCQWILWQRYKYILSLAGAALGMLLFVISSQPYAATFLLINLSIQLWMLVKKP